MPWPPILPPTGYLDSTERGGDDIDIEPTFHDDFDRVDGVLGADWTIPTQLPEDTVAGTIAIASEGVVCVDDTSGSPAIWGFAQAVPEYVGDHAIAMFITNVFQGTLPILDILGTVELYLHRTAADSSCHVLSCAFDHDTSNGFVSWDVWELDEDGIVVDPAIGGTSTPVVLSPVVGFTIRFEVDADGTSRVFIDGDEVGGGALTPMAGTLIGFGLHWVQN